MRLFIAEKPSLGLAVAQAIGIKAKGRGYIECNNGDRVTWAIGHLLQQYTPDDYDAALKKWNEIDLPIIPEQWKMKVNDATKDQFKIVKGLIKEAKILVNVGDPDREGTLIIDEIFEYCKATQPKKRVLISDLNPAPVKKSISKIQDNALTVNLGNSALARGRADWLVGMNLTRAFTLAGRKAGLDHVLSIGRVQTPLLGLIVRRDIEIENFQPKPFYGIEGDFSSVSGELTANWQVIAPESSIDEKGRLIDKDVAIKALDTMHGKKAVVKSVESKSVKSRPPLLFSLSELQKKANKELGLTAKQTLDIAQSLYETHKLTTYPRSDCRYLPVEQLAAATEICTSIIEGISGFKELEGQLSYDQKTPAFNSSKIGAHHAIVPTGKMATSGLSKQEGLVYELVCRQYLAQFLGDRITSETEVIIDLGSDALRFKAAGAVLVSAGFSVLFKGKADKMLPAFSEGENLAINRLGIVDKMTSPPSKFTEATLLDAMTGIAKFLKDPTKAAALKETDGLGTEATRAAIIELLVKRQFVIRDKKNFVSTTLGRDLITSLPEVLTWPDMTAIWERQLNEISEGNIKIPEFLEEIQGKVRELVTNAQSQKLDVNIEVHSCPKCTLPLRRFKKKTKGFFWACTGYRENGCDYSTDDKKGTPDLTEKKLYPCPDCSKPLAKRKGSNGAFWSCTGYKEGCKYTCNDNRNKPDTEGKKVQPKKESKTQDCPKCSTSISRKYSVKKEFYFWMHDNEGSESKCQKFIKDNEGEPVAS
jgi:DNA topoisomerase-3